jgi:ABC-type lipoprotein release transport system permease subunit
VALGGQAPRVVFEMLRRPLRHVATGVVAGCMLVGGLVLASRSASATSVGLLAVYAVAMLGVCALACIGPTMRALRVEPTEAMRAEV